MKNKTKTQTKNVSDRNYKALLRQPAKFFRVRDEILTPMIQRLGKLEAVSNLRSSPILARYIHHEDEEERLDRFPKTWYEWVLDLHTNLTGSLTLREDRGLA